MMPIGRPDRGARVLLTAASLVVVIAGLRASGTLILPLLVAIFVAIVSSPLLAWLRRNRAPVPVAVITTVLVDIAVLVVLILLVTRAVNELATLGPRYQDRVTAFILLAIDWLRDRGFDISRRESLELVNPGAVLDLLGTILRGLLSVLSNMFLVLLTLVFLLFEATSFPRKLRVAFGGQANVERLGRLMGQVQRYLVIKTLTSLGTGLLVATWAWTMGLDFPMLWGLLAFILNYIPNIGSILAAVPAVILAMIQLGPAAGAILALGYLLINIGMSNFLEPPLMGHQLGLSPAMVFISLVFWGWVWGPVGMLLAVPLTVILKIMLEHTEDFRWLAVLLGPAPPEGTAPVVTTTSLAEPVQPRTGSAESGVRP
jgi:AI-2 transport protein TqsA